MKCPKCKAECGSDIFKISEYYEDSYYRCPDPECRVTNFNVRMVKQ